MTLSITSANEQSRPVDLENASIVEIVEHILRRFHQPLREELPRLLNRARAIETRPGAPVGLAEHLDQVTADLGAHLDKEEKILFPLLCAGRGPMALMPIKVMMAEHEDHLTNLRGLRALTADFTPPPFADTSWRELYRDLERLESELTEHIRLENQVLFTRAIPSDDGE
jgi:regulator of cell morphogenesis and NO signaling